MGGKSGLGGVVISGSDTSQLCPYPMDSSIKLHKDGQPGTKIRPLAALVVHKEDLWSWDGPAGPYQRLPSGTTRTLRSIPRSNKMRSGHKWWRWKWSRGEEWTNNLTTGPKRDPVDDQRVPWVRSRSLSR